MKQKLKEAHPHPRGTNWRKDGGPAPRTPRANMMGEGYGNSLLLDGPKYTASGPVTPDEEPARKVRTPEERAESAAKARRTKERKAKLEVLKAAKIEAGAALVGQRVFLLTFGYGDWDLRAKAYGGIPEGVDIAASQFGELLIVPVIEEEEGKALGLTAGFRDRDGRTFWVRQTYLDRVSQVFGKVEWRKPLTVKQVEEFGVRLR